MTNSSTAGTPGKTTMVAQDGGVAGGKVRARLLLAALGVLLLAGAAPRSAPQTGGRNGASGEDMALHLATIERIASGHAYYVAVGEELRARRYPTRSIFNWRTPAFYRLVALDPFACRVVLGVLALVVLFAAVKLLSRLPVGAVLVGSILQAGALGTAADSTAWMFHEVWAGMFIALSALAYAARFWRSGAVLALVALFLRELAAPYVAVCAVLAIRGRRRHEAGVLAVGGVLYAFYYGLHLTNVLAHQRPDDIAHGASWIQLGGLDFVLATLRTSNLLNDMPVAVLAGALTLLLAGTLHDRLAPHLRGTAAVYVLLFCIAGQPFNWYWGWIPGLIVPIVMAHGLIVVQRLVLEAAGRPRAGAVPLG